MVSPPRPSISGDLTDGKVLQLLYGNYDALKGRAIWQATEGDLQRYELDSGFGQTVHTEVILNEQIYQDGEIRRIVLTSTNLESGNGCHACSPVIGGALFTQTQGGWMLDFEQRIIGHMGSWGTPPPVELVRIGPDRYGAVFLHEYQSQGLISRTAFFIAPIATSFVKILTLDVGRDDRGFYVDGSGVAYSSTYRLVPGDNGDYYELVVRTSGTRQDSNGTVVPINDTTTYVFSGMRYEPKL